MLQKLDPAKQTLLDAADYIEEHGWCQGTFKDENGGVCIIGAIGELREATKIEPHHYLELVNLWWNKYGVGVTTWNDTPGRTKEEVVSTLRNLALS